MERIDPPEDGASAVSVAVQKAEPVPPPATNVQHAYDVNDEKADGPVTRVQ